MICPSHQGAGGQVAGTQIPWQAQASCTDSSLQRQPPDQPSCPQTTPDPRARPGPRPHPPAWRRPSLWPGAARPAGPGAAGAAWPGSGDARPARRRSQGWKVRDAAGGPAATHWARPGGGVAPPLSPSLPLFPGGRVFLQACPNGGFSESEQLPRACLRASSWVLPPARPPRSSFSRKTGARQQFLDPRFRAKAQ